MKDPEKVKLENRPPNPSGGVDPFPIEGPMRDWRYRVANGGLTPEEREYRAKWLKDQILPPMEPLPLIDEYKLKFNPIRRFYRFPLDKLYFKMEPSMGPTKAMFIRHGIGKIAMVIMGMYVITYYLKYHKLDWTRRHGVGWVSSSKRVFPGEPGYPHVTKMKPSDYYNLGFKDAEI